MNTSTISLRVKNNLEFLAKKHGLSVTDVSEGAKVSQATVSRLFGGVTDDPRASTLDAIASFFNISVDQLIGNTPISISNISTSTKDVTYIPILSLDNPHTFFSVFGKTTHGNWVDWLETGPSIHADCFAVRVKGESMWPQFIEGTFLIIDPDIQPRHRDFVLCSLNTQDLVLRQYLEEGNERILKAINTGYRNLPLTEKDTILGVVIQSRSDYRQES